MGGGEPSGPVTKSMIEVLSIRATITINRVFSPIAINSIDSIDSILDIVLRRIPTLPASTIPLQRSAYSIYST